MRTITNGHSRSTASGRVYQIYLAPYDISVRKVAQSLESWLAMQDQYDLWRVRKSVDLKDVKKVNLSAA